MFIIAGIHSFNDRDFYRRDRMNDGIASMLLGGTLIGSGALSKRNLRLQKQQQERDRLRSVFYGLLRQTDTVTVLQFAIAAQVAGEVAKPFLEQQAQIFGAEFDISDRGEITYRFRSSQWPPIALPAPVADAPQLSSEMFDVVLFSCPPKQKLSVIKAVRDLTGMSLKRAKSLIDSAPQSVMQNIPRDLAEAYVQRLERAGAVVTLSAHQKQS
ncbi:ribosomal protein L7/L12 [Microcoleus sp. FACHB-1515]|uniref:bL12 family ribosomal protein n=1 Tax=Cyanophyceae TaxID=3028117 RepID=UPI0016872826|nr:bL12 family ribosomal protein [Microcoleus sp. FACHB-1515]MBD2090533.1 ribosomal protein L7/L12 [Microcoleus sp. FACHB-1515]